ncbi:MAG: DUF72 domain-containing protein, partial [Bacteroidetes bacterium]|nr:DUF72 domain-containing protein [Fibrella sp.]
MEFGKIANIDAVNFTLPPGNPFNATIWAGAESTTRPSVFIGGPIWANKE